MKRSLQPDLFAGEKAAPIGVGEEAALVTFLAAMAMEGSIPTAVLFPNLASKQAQAVRPADAQAEWVLSAVFNPDGDAILPTSGDGTAKLWRIYPTLQSKVGVAQERLSRGFTDAECARFFSDDRDSCPQTVEAMFALFENDLAAP